MCIRDSYKKIPFLHLSKKCLHFLENDNIRGLTDASARRESPSNVFGILTPDGNQFVMDDGEQQLIRLRTKSGAQILLDETNGNVYLINKKGIIIINTKIKCISLIIFYL